jgi:hypothetical protein
MTSVRGLLISGPESNLFDFHIAVCFALISHEKRASTVYYGCMEESLAMALEAATRHDVTVQEIIGAGDTERYQTLRMGSHGMAWKPRKKKGAAT